MTPLSAGRPSIFPARGSGAAGSRGLAAHGGRNDAVVPLEHVCRSADAMARRVGSAAAACSSSNAWLLNSHRYDQYNTPAEVA